MKCIIWSAHPVLTTGSSRDPYDGKAGGKAAAPVTRTYWSRDGGVFWMQTYRSASLAKTYRNNAFALRMGHKCRPIGKHAPGDDL